MEDLNVVNGINNASSWLVKNQDLLIQYAVNIVAAIAILIVGMIIARVVSNALNRVMKLRGIDATVSDFLSAMARYAILAFTFIAVLGRVGVQTTSVIAVLGAAGLAVGLALQGSLSNFAAGVLLVASLPAPSIRCRFSPPRCVRRIIKPSSCRTVKSSPATSPTTPASRTAAWISWWASPITPISTR